MTERLASTRGETERLCRFVAETGYGDLPADVREHATAMIVDTVGVTLAGVESDPVRVLRDAYGTEFGASGEARIPGHRPAEWGSARDVALLTGVAAHALDFDDVHHRMGGHPSSPVLAALLPVAEREGASGRDLLRSFVLGTEVELALAEVLNPGHYERGWHPTAVLGTLGAAAAVGDLLGLGTAGLRTAVGIAASRASGTKGNFGTMTKPLHVGDAARAGQGAADLAAAGFSADDRILELDFGGFCDLFQGDPGFAFDDHLDRLGSPWGLLDPPVGFKPYPCCGSAHAAIDAALALRDRLGFSPDGIDAVRVVEHPRRLGHTDDPDPTTALDGKFSVQYCVAAALRDGEVWLDHFDDETVASARYRSLLDRVEVVGDREAFADREWGARVTAVVDGEEHTVAVDAPRGAADRPMTGDEVDRKYRRCASIALDDDAVETSLATLRDIGSVDDVGAVVDELG